MTDDHYQSLYGDFILDAEERVTRVEETILGLADGEEEGGRDRLVEAKRELHTLKGNAGMMGLRDLQALAHELEDRLADLRKDGADIKELLEGLDRFRSLMTRECADPRGAKGGEETSAPADGEKDHGTVQGSVRVPFRTLDELVDLLAEMVIFRNRLADAVFRGRTMESASRAWEEVEGAYEALRKSLNFIQDRIMRLRMVPLGTLFGHLKRIVHDEGSRTGKEVRFTTSGGDTPMDKALLEVSSEALGHLIRNAVVHGIETPGERKARGKPPEGSIRLLALTHANEVRIEVADDGAGINRESLLAAAKRNNREAAAADNIFSLLFMPGVSTSRGADTGSGRGMGLAAAMEAAQRLGGRIEVESEEGSGSVFRIHLPLSVSITRSILLKADGEEYALPMTSVVESLRLGPGQIHQINHAGIYSWRGVVIPVVDLGYIFGTTTCTREKGLLVIIEAEGKKRGLLVDDITGIQEIVVKGLDPLVGSPRGISSSTILGDGRVILILDPAGLVATKPFVEEKT